MVLPLLRRVTKFVSNLPLQAMLILPSVLQILVVAGLIGLLSFWNGEHAVKSLATKLEGEIGERVEQTLETYLKMPQLANQANADAVRQGLLDLNDLESVQTRLWNQFHQFNDQYASGNAPTNAPTSAPIKQPSSPASSPASSQSSNQQPDDISFLAIGTAQGNYADVGYYPTNGHLTRGYLDRAQDETLRIWLVDQWGKKQALEDQITPYDPRSRDWYKRAVQAGHLVWVGPYGTVSPIDDFVISADQPLFDRQGNLVGVTDATLSLLDINRFLASLQVGQSGQVFVMELDGDLLATSTGEKPFISTGDGLESLGTLESSNMVTRETAAYLRQKFGAFDRIDYGQQRQPQQLDFRDSHGKKQLIRVESFRNERHPGLDWLVVIAVPADDFMAQIRANTHVTTLLCLLGVLGAIGSGIVAGRWLTRPLVQLSRAADAMAQGDWNRPVTIHRSGELGLLVNAFNHMRRELRHSQQQLEEYSHGLEQKNEQLETLETELRRQLNLFLHAVSHDLRNPVLGMSMVLNNLSNQSGNEVTLSRQVLERMQESSKHQLELINSLIDTHAGEIWGISLHTQPVTLRRLVESAIADLQPMMEKEQTQLVNLIDADLHAQVDPLQLSRVYQNLLANALKHNPSGLTVTLDARRDSQPEGEILYCTVTDDGTGIHPDQCDRLFDPYFRGNSRPKSVGLGLGLYLCQQIVQAHGGKIGVKSQPGAGTMFWFTLPMGQTDG
jgi:two-component system sensor histidine kinase ChiS